MPAKPAQSARRLSAGADAGVIVGYPVARGSGGPGEAGARLSAYATHITLFSVINWPGLAYLRAAARV